MTKFRKELGMRIFQARNELGWKQATLAKKLGVSPSIVSNYEAGHRGITIDRIQQIATTLGVSVGWLVGEVR